jgi:hypothetical protein
MAWDAAVNLAWVYRWYQSAQPSVFLGHDVARGLFKLAELLAECDLLFVGDVLATEHQHCESIHALMNGYDLGVTEFLSEVDSIHPANKTEVVGIHGVDGHREKSPA